MDESGSGRARSAQVIVVPGIGGSGEGHWQTLWERDDPAMVRFSPASWDAPDRDDWVEALERAVAAAAEPPVLVAHSLGCLAVAHWAAATRLKVRGAFLVAVPDPEGPAFPAAARSFAAPPATPLGFPARLVASRNDPYATLAHARERARQWQASLVVAGSLGHINAESGLGDWTQGRDLLESFRQGTAIERPAARRRAARMPEAQRWLRAASKPC